MRRTLTTLLLIALVLLGPVIPAAAQGDARWITHIVQPEENLFRIALRYNLAVDVVMAANGLTDANLVIAGQQLVIPLGSNTITTTANSGVVPPAAPIQTTVLGNTVMHTVASGDTLSRLAARYGITVNALANTNGLARTSALAPGQLLVIPVASSADLGLIGVTAVASATTSSPSAVPGAESGFTQPDLGLIGVEIPIPPAPLAESAPTTNSEPVSVPVAAADIPPVSESEPDSIAPEETTPVEEEATEVEETPAEVAAESAPVGEETDVTLDDTPASSTAAASSAEPAPATVIDLGILPGDSGASVAETSPAVADSDAAVSNADSAADNTFTPMNQPDLGIIAPEAAWLAQTNVFSLGDGDLRAIYIKGLAMGNNPHAFTRIGDCNSEQPFFLAKFDRGEYNLGPYSQLQDVLDHFAGSFDHQSMSAWTGNHVWAVLDPTWANPAYCLVGETPLECEFRRQKPSILLIRLGTNEAYSPQLFEENMRRVVAFALERGTIPVLATKADQRDANDAINTIIRNLAAEYKVPLWDFSAAAAHIPARGLSSDGIHLTYFPPDYTQPFALQSGHGLQNLTALMVLDAIWQEAMY